MDDQADQMFQRKMRRVISGMEDQFSDSRGVLGKLIDSAITDFHLRCNEAFLWDEFFALTRTPEAN